MGEGMPYHLEKGPLLRILERHLNSDRAGMQARLEILKSSEADSLDWLLTGAPELWADPAFTRGPLTGDEQRQRLIAEWFGYEEDGAGGWRKPEPPPTTTGYWIGYRGDVHQIVRTAVKWALELALATGRGAPWTIELLWKCPAPWFEAWVVSRRIAGTKRGLVTIILVTPSHEGAEVSESPIAHSAESTPPGATHPIPSWQDDYERYDADHPDPTSFPDRPRVPALERQHAMWVVTHERHDIAQRRRPTDGNGNSDPFRTFEANTAAPRQFADWSIPLLTVYEGVGPIVIVSPSMASGGVKHDGSV